MSTNISPEDHLRSLAFVMTDAVKHMLHEKAEIELSAEPVMKIKPITEFARRMRVDGMEKFDTPAVFSVVSFYPDRKKLDKRAGALGSLILYAEQYELDRLLKWLDYPQLDDEEDEAELKDSIGTICNLLGGYFVREVEKLGFAHLEMSPFESYVNSAPNGVEFPSTQSIRCEVAYEFRKKKRLILDLAIGALPKVKDK